MIKIKTRKVKHGNSCNDFFKIFDLIYSNIERMDIKLSNSEEIDDYINSNWVISSEEMNIIASTYTKLEKNKCLRL